jgi:hypothetical protein
MKPNPFSRLIVYENMLDDFSMPNSIYGKIEYEILLEKYKKLSNKPTHYLQTRYQQYQW